MYKCAHIRTLLPATCLFNTEGAGETVLEETWAEVATVVELVDDAPVMRINDKELQFPAISANAHSHTSPTLYLSHDPAYNVKVSALHVAPTCSSGMTVQ